MELQGQLPTTRKTIFVFNHTKTATVVEKRVISETECFFLPAIELIYYILRYTYYIQQYFYYIAVNKCTCTLDIRLVKVFLK